MEKDNKRKKYSFQPYEIKKGEIYKYIRINPFKENKEKELLEFLGKEFIKKEKNYYVVKAEKLNFAKFRFIDFINIQDRASMLAVENLELKEEDKLLDCCAAPGNKTIYSAQIMKNKGAILAIDKNIQRTKNMQSLLRTHLIINTTIILDDFLKAKLPQFDKILLDAPCTGEGTMVNQGIKEDLKQIYKMQEIQKKMILKAYSLLKPKGTLIYSTCTLNYLENEAVVQYLLENTDAFLEKPETDIKTRQGFHKIFNSELKKTIRFYPDISHTIGFYIAKVKKP